MENHLKFSRQTYLILFIAFTILILCVSLFFIYQKNVYVEEPLDNSIIIVPDSFDNSSFSFLNDYLTEDDFNELYYQLEKIHLENLDSLNYLSYVENSFSVESSNPLKASFKITSDANLNFRIILDKTSETLKITTKQIP